jgi:hypothetical protein
LVACSFLGPEAVFNVLPPGGHGGDLSGFTGWFDVDNRNAVGVVPNRTQQEGGENGGDDEHYLHRLVREPEQTCAFVVGFQG